MDARPTAATAAGLQLRSDGAPGGDPAGSRSLGWPLPLLSGRIAGALKGEGDNASDGMARVSPERSQQTPGAGAAA